jgi:hypothetical protein
VIEDRAEPACPRQSEGRRKEVRRGALSEIENRAALREILHGPPADLPDDDDDIVDPQEGREPVPPTLDELLDDLRSIERRYARTSWWDRRFMLRGWLDEISHNYGPFRCLDDLSTALELIDRTDPPGHPMLQPDNRPGRPKLTRTEFQNRCMIALAIDVLKVPGWSIEGSTKAIAKWLSKRSVSSVRIRSTRYSSVPVRSWETIKHWREEIVRIAQGKGQHRALIREIAADYLRQRERLPGVIEARRVDPKRMAVLLLEQMRPLSRLGKTEGPLFPKAR